MQKEAIYKSKLEYIIKPNHYLHVQCVRIIHDVP